MKKIDTSKSVIFGKKIEHLENGYKIEYLKSSLNFLNKECYFSDSEDFSDYEEDILISVLAGDDVEYPYESMHYQNFNYFIPKDKVVFIEEPKKLRPYKDIGEFANETGCEVLGEDFITIRDKNTHKVYVLLYIGYSEDTVFLGGYSMTFSNLLENYEFLTDEWLPLGVEE